MRFEFSPAFGRSLKRLPPQEHAQVEAAAAKLIDFYSTGERTPGLGIAHLRGPYWEGRSGLKTRILYRWTRDLVQFILAGNHDDVKRFLSRI